MGKRIVEVGLAYIRLEAVDILERDLGIEREGIWAEANYWPVLLVQTPEFQVAVAGVGVLELVGVCELCNEGARIFSQWMKKDSVDCDYESL